jgi:hypothetical protein
LSGFVQDSVKVKATTAGCPEITPATSTIALNGSQTFTVTGNNTPLTLQGNDPTGISPSSATVPGSVGTAVMKFTKAGSYSVVVTDSKGNLASASVLVTSPTCTSNGCTCGTNVDCSSGCCAGSVCSASSTCSTNQPLGTACTTNAKCASGCCSANVCAIASACGGGPGPGPIGTSCSAASDCQSGCCSANSCADASACGGGGGSCTATQGYKCGSDGTCTFATTGAGGVSYPDCVGSCSPSSLTTGFLIGQGGICHGSGSCDPTTDKTGFCYSSLGACLAASGQGVSGVDYDPSSKTCVFTSGGFYGGTADCQACNPAPKRYTCNAGLGKCLEDPTGFSTDPACGGGCTKAVIPTYNCNNITHTCYDPGDETGLYSSAQAATCAADCAATGTSYNCDSSGNNYSCVAVSGPGGTYASKAGCNAGCCVPAGSKATGACCTGLNRCADGSCSASCGTPTCPQSASLSVSPGSASLEIGTVSPQFKANYYATGASCSSATDVTNSAVWTASPATTLSVAGKGLVKGLAKGSGTFSATYSGVSGSANITVTDPSIGCSFSADKTSITIPPQASVNLTWSCSSGSGDPTGITCSVGNDANLPKFLGRGATGTVSVFPTSTTNFTLDCTNTSGNKSPQYKVQVKVRNINIIEPAPR